MGHQRLPRLAPQPLRRGPPVPLDTPSAAALPETVRSWRWPWADSPRLGDILTPEHNSFGVLRLLLALAVLASHAVFLATGKHAAEPMVSMSGYSLGQYAVQGFFILSGILVTQSLLNRGSALDYLSARALRIFPALVVCVLLTAFVAGPALSFFGMQGYFLSTGVPNYIFQTVSLSTGSAQLPGVFALNPVGGAINQSIWTLKYEVACYLLLAGIAAAVWRSTSPKKAAGIALAVWASLILIWRPSLADTASFPTLLAYFSLFFGTGVVAYLARDVIRIAWQPLPVLAFLFVAAWGTDFAEITSALFLGYSLLWLATQRFGDLRAFANASDYSYGVYLYSFPVTQALLQLWPGINLVSLIAATTGITFALAFLSWELVERPALWFARRRRASRDTADTASTAASLSIQHDATGAAVVTIVDPPAEAVPEVVAATWTAEKSLADRARLLKPLTPAGMALEPQPQPRLSLRNKLKLDAIAAPSPVFDRSRLDARMARIASRPQPSTP